MRHVPERPKLAQFDSGRVDVGDATRRRHTARDAVLAAGAVVVVRLLRSAAVAVQRELERMLAGVSTRRYPRTQEPVGEDVETRSRSTSKSAVSRTFVERTRESLTELMGRDLADMRLAVMMVDGIELKGRTNIVALGITTQGVKIPLGLWEASTEGPVATITLIRPR